MNRGEVTFPSLLVISGIISVKRKMGARKWSMGKGPHFLCRGSFSTPKGLQGLVCLRETGLVCLYFRCSHARP